MTFANELVPYKRLALRVDVERLRTDLANIPSDAWVPISRRWFECRGSYDEARLVHPANQKHTQPTEYHDLLSLCPYSRDLLDSLGFEITHFRLNRMGPHSRLTTHIDKYGKYVEDRVRLHIPVVTNPQSWLTIAGERLDAKPGECWYLDNHVLHGATNNSDQPRIHLIIDCKPNEYINQLLGFDIRAYRQKNILALNDHMRAYVRRKQRWLRLDQQLT